MTNSKYRTITLTNRAPIRIAENDWPVIAQGGWSFSPSDDERVQIDIRARHHAHEKRYIVHAGLDINKAPVVRVGRLVTVTDSDEASLWQCIKAVGDDMRERIHDELAREHVIDAIDRCFANLSAIQS